MRLHHYALIFIIFVIALVVIVDVDVSTDRKIIRSINTLDSAVEDATVAATNKLQGSIYGNILAKEDAVSAFFDSLGADLCILDNPMALENLHLYFPVFLVTDFDGFYISYLERENSDGNYELKRRWTGKIYYCYYDSIVGEGRRATDFVYKFIDESKCLCCDTQGILGTAGQNYLLDVSTAEEQVYSYNFDDLIITKNKNYEAIIFDSESYKEKRQMIISETMERCLSYYCNLHNKLAEDYGIMYNFAIPAYDSTTYLRCASGVSFMAFFQGYPIEGTEKTYNRFVVSNTQVVDREVYYIDKQGLYHRASCEKIGEIVDLYYEKKTCAEQGAFPCDCCK